MDDVPEKVSYYVFLASWFKSKFVEIQFASGHFGFGPLVENASTWSAKSFLNGP